jgi:oxygen-independent coproporphyrinogen-3 oxidase
MPQYEMPAARAGSIATVLDSAIREGAIPPFVYCYPTRSSYRELSPEWTLNHIWEEDFKHSLTRDLNIYFHIPFCRYKCGFCNLYTVTSTDEDLYDAYVDALCLELRRHATIIRSRNVRTIYFGGGTPSLLSTAQFERIFQSLDEVCANWRPTVEEVCVEATPDSIVASPAKIKRLVELGLTRVNMGVQSLEASELREAGRALAGPSIVSRATAIIKNSGVPNLSTDLIMGFASQTDDSWLSSVKKLLALDAETISTYFLTVRPDAWFSKTGKYIYARDPQLYRRYDVARELILDAGYVQESNVRYKKLGLGGYRQKVLQFRGVPVLGIGLGARTYTNTVDYLVAADSRSHPSQVWDYIVDACSRGARIHTGFVYDDVERIRKRLALDLFDLDLASLEPYGYSGHRQGFDDVLAAGVEMGLLRNVTKTRYQLTVEGYKYRDILSWLFFSDEVVSRDKEFYEGLHHANSRAVDRIGTALAVSGLTTAGLKLEPQGS